MTSHSSTRLKLTLDIQQQQISPTDGTPPTMWKHVTLQRTHRHKLQKSTADIPPPMEHVLLQRLPATAVSAQQQKNFGEEFLDALAMRLAFSQANLPGNFKSKRSDEILSSRKQRSQLQTKRHGTCQNTSSVGTLWLPKLTALPLLLLWPWWPLVAGLPLQQLCAHESPASCPCTLP